MDKKITRSKVISDQNNLFCQKFYLPQEILGLSKIFRPINFLGLKSVKNYFWTKNLDDSLSFLANFSQSKRIKQN